MTAEECTCSVYFGCSEYAHDCPRHGVEAQRAEIDAPACACHPLWHARSGAVDMLADLAAEHLRCSGCQTPWWLLNWLSQEAAARPIPPEVTP